MFHFAFVADGENDGRCFASLHQTFSVANLIDRASIIVPLYRPSLAAGARFAAVAALLGARQGS